MVIALCWANRKIIWRRKWQPTPVFFPGKPHGQPGGLQPMGSQRVRQDWVHTHTHTHKLLVIPLCEHLNLRQQWSGFEIWSEPCGPAETLVLLELSAPVGFFLFVCLFFFFFKGKIVYQQKIWKSQLIIQAEPLNYMVFKVGIEGGFQRPK